jgi:hypothetical protein
MTQALERRRGFYVFYTVGSHLAIRLSALCANSCFPAGIFLVLISVIGYVDLRAIMKLEGLDQSNYDIASLGIKHATFRLVAQCQNKLCYRVSPV